MFDENNKLSLKLNNPGSTGFSDVSVAGPKGDGGNGGRWVVTAPYNPRIGCTEIGVSTFGNATNTQTDLSVDWVVGRFV